jgi:DNA-directed RNA polymerase specialized sigma24 family protein
MAMADSAQQPEKARVFLTTHWSVVLAAGEADSESARKALEHLCHAYWYPIYVYVRRKGYGPEDAEDLTQEFFAQLIAKHQLRLADREKGKFRTFLLSMLDYFLAREWNRAHRQKRGGQFKFLSLDQLTPEERYALEPADNDTPEKKFHRQWALTVLKETMHALEKECEADGKAALFGEVKNLLSGERPGGAYAGVSERLGMAEGAARVAVHRLRQRYGELLRQEIGKTVNQTSGVEEELAYLMGVLSQ